MRREAICIGVDVAENSTYGRRLRILQASRLDAESLAAAAAERRFHSMVMLREQATVANVTGAIAAAASRLEAGDTLLLAFSGHGLAGRTPFGFQQSWCLYDRALLRFGADGLDAQLARFSPGVRICIVMNCCCSGSDASAKPRTPEIRAHVVRIAACGADEIAYDSKDRGTPSPFVSSVTEVMRSRPISIFDFYERVAANSVPHPQLEIGDPRNEDFLREGL